MPRSVDLRQEQGSGKRFSGLNRLADRLETGDGYAHHEPKDPQELYGQCSGWKRTVSEKQMADDRDRMSCLRDFTA